MNMDMIGTMILEIIRTLPFRIFVYSKIVIRKVSAIMVRMVYRRYKNIFFIKSPTYLYVFV